MLDRYNVAFFRPLSDMLMYRSIPKPPIPPPGQTPGHLTFFEKFWSNSPLCCQFRRSNAPPVRASKRIKSPTLQGKKNRLPLEINRIAYLWKQVLQISSHCEFLVQLVCAPRFKQRHIPRYNYVKRQQQQKKSHVELTRATTRERGSRAEAKNCEILLFPTADRRFGRKVKCPTGRASSWVKFPTVRSLT